MRNPSGAGSTLTGTLSKGKFTGTVTADYSTISGQYQASVAGEPATANGTFQGTLCPETAPGSCGSVAAGFTVGTGREAGRE